MQQGGLRGLFDRFVGQLWRRLVLQATGLSRGVPCSPSALPAQPHCAKTMGLVQPKLCPCSCCHAPPTSPWLSAHPPCLNSAPRRIYGTRFHTEGAELQLPRKVPMRVEPKSYFGEAAGAWRALKWHNSRQRTTLADMHAFPQLRHILDKTQRLHPHRDCIRLSEGPNIPSCLPRQTMTTHSFFTLPAQPWSARSCHGWAWQ